MHDIHKEISASKSTCTFLPGIFCSDIIVTSCMRAIQRNYQCLFLHRGSNCAPSLAQNTRNLYFGRHQIPVIAFQPKLNFTADRLFWHCFPTKNVGLHSTWQNNARKATASLLPGMILTSKGTSVTWVVLM